MDQKLKRRSIHRAKIIRGQMEGLIQAIEDEVYCPSLLERSVSIQKSLKSLDAYMLENHLRTHVKHQMRRNKEEIDQAVQELVKVYTLSNKS